VRVFQPLGACLSFVQLVPIRPPYGLIRYPCLSLAPRLMARGPYRISAVRTFLHAGHQFPLPLLHAVGNCLHIQIPFLFQVFFLPGPIDSLLDAPIPVWGRAPEIDIRLACRNTPTLLVLEGPSPFPSAVQYLVHPLPQIAPFSGSFIS